MGFEVVLLCVVCEPLGEAACVVAELCVGELCVVVYDCCGVWGYLVGGFEVACGGEAVAGDVSEA